MKNLIILVLVSLICTNVLNSQWLEKEGYWELQQNYGDLRDIKLNEATGELLIVTADNNVISIDSKTGIETKRCVCELDSNYNFAKISNDFQSIIFSYFTPSSHNSTIKISDIFMDIWNPKSCERISKLIIKDNRKKNYFFQSASINFADYIVSKKLLILGLSKYAQWQGDGPNQYSSLLGNFYVYEMDADTFHLKFENGRDSYFSTISDIRENKFYITSGTGGSQSWTNSGGGGTSDDASYLSMFDLNKNVLQDTFVTKYSESHGGGHESPAEGYYIPLEEIIQSKSDGLIYIKSTNKILTFNLIQKKINDSLTFKYIPSNLSLSFNDSYLHVTNGDLFLNYNLKFKQLLDSIKLPSSIEKYDLSQKEGKLFIFNSDQKIRFITPNIFKPVPDIGLIFDKPLVQAGDSINFVAVCNLDSCEYEWEFEPGIITKTKNKEIEHIYLQTGIYSVKLSIKTPDGTKHDFEKKKIIRIIDKLKADFSFQILNDELPLKVQFTDLSKGEIIERLWDFGDGNTSTELNPIHEYKFKGDFTVSLIVNDTLGTDSLVKYETILLKTPVSNLDSAKKIILSPRTSKFKNSYIVSNGFIITSYYYYLTIHHYKNNQPVYNYTNQLIFNHFDIDFLSLKKDTLNCGTNEVPFFNPPTSLELQLKDYLFAIDTKFWEDTYKIIYDSETHKLPVFKIPAYPYKWIEALILLSPAYNKIFSIFDRNSESEIIVFDYLYENLSELRLPTTNNKLYLADTISGGLNLILKKLDNSYKYFSISPENTINYEKSFSLDTNISLSNIKSVNDNLLLLYGSVEDKENNTTYAYFGKYHPLDNTVEDTILYSRKDLRKIERINDKWFAAIGQSRGRQGYLILDTNLQQVKDIRVDSLTGEIKDMLLHDNKVYLFTEKIIIEATNSLGPNERYQTTGSVLELPEEIIASVENIPVITGNSFTHSVYPNPANDMFRLKIGSNSTSIYTIKLYDLFGREVMKIFDGMVERGEEKIFNLSVSALNTGTYYYTIFNGYNSNSGKLMVVR